jgi:predicted acylesterase/phospholipase RssA
MPTWPFGEPTHVRFSFASDFSTFQLITNYRVLGEVCPFRVVAHNLPTGRRVWVPPRRGRIPLTSSATRLQVLAQAFEPDLFASLQQRDHVRQQGSGQEPPRE